MARHGLSLGATRPLALAVTVAASLLAPAGFSAQAAQDDSPEDDGASPPSSPAATVAPSDPYEGSVPLAAPPPAPPAPPSTTPTPVPAAATPTAVTVARATSSASKTVSIVDFAFKPGAITVTAGDSVQWTNKGTVPEGHDVTGDGLDSGLLNEGDSYTHTFREPGTFSYICTIHPNMKGTVKVRGRSSGSAGSGGAGSGGGSAPAAPTGAGSESAAVSSPGGAGSDSSLPATGSRSLWMLSFGLALLDLGLVLRVLWPRRADRSSQPATTPAARDS